MRVAVLGGTWLVTDLAGVNPSSLSISNGLITESSSGSSSGSGSSSSSGSTSGAAGQTFWDDNNCDWVTGTSGNDVITIKKDADGTHDDVWVNVPTAGAPTAQVLIAQPIIGHHLPESLGDTSTLRAVFGVGLYLAVLGLMSLAIGAIVRHTAAARMSTTKMRRSADMRYGEQVFEISVPLDGVEWHGADLGGQVRAAFHARHQALFTYALPEEEVVLVNAKVAVVGRLPEAAALSPAAGLTATAPRAHRHIRLEGGAAVEAVPVFRFEALAPDQALSGPAIVESATTTVLLLPGDTARMDARGWLAIALPG